MLSVNYVQCHLQTFCTECRYAECRRPLQLSIGDEQKMLFRYQFRKKY